MNKKDILEDESLEFLGLIKDIDTLLVIDKANRINEIRQKKLKIMGTFFLASIAVFLNFTILMTLGFKALLGIQLFFSWVILIFFVPILKKKLI